MNQKDKNLKFNKSLINNSNIKSSNPQNQRDKIKLKIIQKYNVSFEEAERILSHIEKKELGDLEVNQKKDVYRNDSEYIKQVPKSNSNENSVSHRDGLDRKNNVKIKNDIISNKNPNSNNLNSSNPDILRKRLENHNIDLKNEPNVRDINNSLEMKNIPKSGETRKKQLIKSNLTLEHNDIKNNGGHVDSLLEDIIPNYNQQISVKVEHVDLTFEVSNEKIDTLKETFIRTLKRTKSKKIKIHALKDVSFQIFKGEKVGIIGYNGAGKSTLLNVITGIYPPDKGIVTTFGNISPLLSLGAGFDPNFSGRKNIILNGAVLGYDKNYLESKIDEIIEFSELGEFIDIPIKNYSSGMLAKLGFSIATLVNPDILIIDEILGVGDVNFAKKSRDKIRSLMDGGTTVLLVSHSIPQIRELCDKAIWIDKGRVRDIGEVNKVCDAYLKDAEKASNTELANIQLVN